MHTPEENGVNLVLRMSTSGFSVEVGKQSTANHYPDVYKLCSCLNTVYSREGRGVGTCSDNMQ